MDVIAKLQEAARKAVEAADRLENCEGVADEDEGETEAEAETEAEPPTQAKAAETGSAEVTAPSGEPQQHSGSPLA